MTNVLIGVVVVAIAIFAMINIAIGTMPREKKMIWFAIVVLIPLIGPIAYYVVKPYQ